MSVEQVILGLGANLGDRVGTLKSAREALAREHVFLAESSLYETEPIGLREQPAFLNQVVAIQTAQPPEALLAACLGVEKAHGRERGVRNGPRTLDIDILFYGERTLCTDALEVPHPRWRERAFVVVPLRELLACPAMQQIAQWDALRAELDRISGTGEVVLFADRKA